MEPHEYDELLFREVTDIEMLSDLELLTIVADPETAEGNDLLLKALQAEVSRRGL